LVGRPPMFRVGAEAVEAAVAPMAPCVRAGTALEAEVAPVAPSETITGSAAIVTFLGL
jgi:hypothetical protein